MDRRIDKSAPQGSMALNATDSLSPAEELLVEFLARCGQPNESSFAALCTANPAHAAELKRLYAEWSALDRILGARGGSRSPLERRLDAPPVQCEEEPTPQPHQTPAAEIDIASTASLDELLARLAGHDSRGSRYQIEEQLGSGGMGVVHKVWDPDLHRHVAMKVLRRARRSQLDWRAAAAQERVLGRFLEEAQITGQLEHPGIVPVHELGLDAESKLYFTMPLVRGRELKEVIRLAREQREGWNLTRALGVMLKVCEAVAYAHSKGVIHRDLKPSNVMVGRFGETYVMDWGLARVLGQVDVREQRLRREDATPPSELIATDVRGRAESTPHSPLATLDGAVIGTAPFMSPEQALGRIDELGPRADVYSIGAMLYQLLTGHMPYVPNGSPVSPHSVLTARLLGPPMPVLEAAPDTPPELAAICEKAMHVDVDRRYGGALELAADIEAFLGHRSVSAFESSLAHAVQLAFRRNKTLFIAITAAVLVALVWGAFDLISSNAAIARESRLRIAAQDAEHRTQELTDFALADVLVREAGELFPAVPERVAAMETWLERTDGVLSRAVQRKALAASVAAKASSATQAELAAFAANVDRLALERPRMDRRSIDARTLVARTIDAYSEQWHAAIESIASLPIYRGLHLSPQRGLVPLQLNPSSGLWEFWVDGTGAAPQLADTATGRLARDPEQALVLVLIPGGTFEMGGLTRDPRAQSDERPREVTLAPYFLGRTEVWQGVWERTMGDNPAQWREGVYNDHGGWTPLLPVEYVDADQCQRFLARFELVLPTEAQWELAARAGESTPTIYGCGDDVACLEDRENIVDQGAPAWLRKGAAPFADGYQLTAPTASYRPNRFGLHDVLGNVSEWCADWYVEDLPDDAPRDASGLAAAEVKVFQVFRGGNYSLQAGYCRVSMRLHDQPVGKNQTRGLRVARPVR